MLHTMITMLFVLLIITPCDILPGSDDSCSYQKAAVSKIGKNYKVNFNSDSTFLIARNIPARDAEKSREEKTKSYLSPLKFIIYSIVEDKTIFEDNLPGGKAEWVNDHQVRVTTVPGIVKGKEESTGNPPGYVYDINIKKKISANIDLQKEN